MVHSHRCSGKLQNDVFDFIVGSIYSHVIPFTFLDGTFNSLSCSVKIRTKKHLSLKFK